MTVRRLLSACALLFTAAPLAAQDPLPKDSLPREIPVGRGSLNQDLITVHFSVGALDIRFMPINEKIIRLLAPDGYAALSALIASQRPLIDSIAASKGSKDPGIAMVTFHALAPNTRFDPRQFTLITPSRRLQPIGVIPLSPTFSNQQLGVRDQASGLVLFDRVIPENEIFSLQYLQTVNQSWESMIRRLDAERTRIVGAMRRDSLNATIKRPR